MAEPKDQFNPAPGWPIPKLSYDAEQRLSALSPREKEILILILQEKPTKSLADYLGIDVNTVATHKARLMQKLGIKTDIGLGALGVRLGVLPAR